jgi:hypothetical protein
MSSFGNFNGSYNLGDNPNNPFDSIQGAGNQNPEYSGGGKASHGLRLSLSNTVICIPSVYFATHEGPI